MHTEHLNNVRLGYVLAGWAIAICATSLFVFILIAANIQSSMSSDGRYIAAAVALGFGVGGAFVGFMTSLAPILHGIMIGLISLIVWALFNVVTSMVAPQFTWTELTSQWTLAVVLVQIIAAILGARFGYRYAVART